MLNTNRSIWLQGLKWGFVPLVLISILTIYVGLSIPASSPGQGQEGLLIILAPIMPIAIWLEVYKISIPELPAQIDMLFILFVMVIPFFIYYLIGLFIAFVLSKLNKKS